MPLPSSLYEYLVTLPKDLDLTVPEAESFLLDQFQKIERGFEVALWELVKFYSLMGKPGEALQYIERLDSYVDDPEKKAGLLLSIGQLMEQMDQYEQAGDFYRQAYALEPENEETWYLINNNLGYCLNRAGEYQEAEGYCRAAIQIDPTRHNAHKNLGVSLGCQGQYWEAAACFITAVQANPHNPRALDHLEQLVESQPWMLGEHPALSGELEQCRALVAAARQARKKRKRAG